MLAPSASLIRRPFTASRRQGRGRGGADAGLDQEGAQLVAVEAQGAGLVVDLRAAKVHCRVAGDDLFLLAVPVEAGQGGQPPGHGGGHQPLFLHPPAEQFQVGPADVEQAQVRLPAPSREQAQVGGVAGPGVPPVGGQEPGHRARFLPNRRILNKNKIRAYRRRHDALLSDPAPSGQGHQHTPPGQTVLVPGALLVPGSGGGQASTPGASAQVSWGRAAEEAGRGFGRFQAVDERDDWVGMFPTVTVVQGDRSDLERGLHS